MELFAGCGLQFLLARWWDSHAALHLRHVWLCVVDGVDSPLEVGSPFAFAFRAGKVLMVYGEFSTEVEFGVSSRFLLQFVEAFHLDHAKELELEEIETLTGDGPCLSCAWHATASD